MRNNYELNVNYRVVEVGDDFVEVIIKVDPLKIQRVDLQILCLDLKEQLRAMRGLARRAYKKQGGKLEDLPRWNQ